MPTKIGDNYYDYFDLEAYCVKKLWILTDSVQKIIDNWIADLGLQGSICAFHVRRGDKVSGRTQEAASQPVEKYLAEAKAANVRCNTCFFSSDTIEPVMHEVNQTIGGYFPACQVKYMASTPLTEGGYSLNNFMDR